MSDLMGRLDEEWPTDPQGEYAGNGVTIPPKPPEGSYVVVEIHLPKVVLPPSHPVHHSQGAKTIPGPVLTEPER